MLPAASDDHQLGNWQNVAVEITTTMFYNVKTFRWPLSYFRLIENWSSIIHLVMDWSQEPQTFTWTNLTSDLSIKP